MLKLECMNSQELELRGTQLSDTCELLLFSPYRRYVIGVSDGWLAVWDSAGE